MIPFIDLLMVTIAFLLITAVWVTYSRMNANAQIPGPPNPEEEVTPETPEKVLHLHINDRDFAIVWKQGSQVISESRVDRPEQEGEIIRYGDLAEKLKKEWKTHGSHQDQSDKERDQAVLHAEDSLEFRVIVAVLDALYAQQRDFALPGGKIKKVPAFNMTFSVR